LRYGLLYSLFYLGTHLRRRLFSVDNHISSLE